MHFLSYFLGTQKPPLQNESAVKFDSWSRLTIAVAFGIIAIPPVTRMFEIGSLSITAARKMLINVGALISEPLDVGASGGFFFLRQN